MKLNDALSQKIPNVYVSPSSPCVPGEFVLGWWFSLKGHIKGASEEDLDKGELYVPKTGARLLSGETGLIRQFFWGQGHCLEMMCWTFRVRVGARGNSRILKALEEGGKNKDRWGQGGRTACCELLILQSQVIIILGNTLQLTHISHALYYLTESSQHLTKSDKIQGLKFSYIYYIYIYISYIYVLYT